ncbi:MAG: phage portal protein [Clostridia bacterium]
MIENTNANMSNANVHKIDNYLNGGHKVKQRKDFKFKDETYSTAKIVLQSIKSIIDFHSSYICGNKVSVTGEQAQLLQKIYKQGNFYKRDYEIAKNLYTYGNAYEYIYKEKEKIKSKIINNSDSYPIYENCEYVMFIEKYIDTLKNHTTEIIYTADKVEIFEDDKLIESYANFTGLPIHYTSGNLERNNIFGTSLIDDLIPIMDELEQLLSKMSDSIGTLSMNPLGVSIGDRVDTSIDKDATGAVLNIESGGDFKYINASLDSDSIKLLLDNLLNQFYVIACVPSSLFGQSNISNVSEVSLKLLYNNSDSMAKRIALNMLEGFETRLEYISKLINQDIADFDINFNYNRPVDNSSLMSDLKVQFDMGAISLESILRNSPYISDVDGEISKLNESNEFDI